MNGSPSRYCCSLALLFVAGLALSTGCQPAAAPPATAETPRNPSPVPADNSADANTETPIAAAPPAEAAYPVIESERLHNLLRVAPRVLSGSGPEGDAAFAELAQRGVKTIISVDGTPPDIETAKAHGMRYIHIPFGYDGVPVESQRALFRVAKEVEGDIYVHCHHGKHRGPAGAAVLCQADGTLDRAAADRYLKAAGTAEDYRGLWQSVREFEPPPATAKLPELREVSPVNPLAEAMVRLDHHLEAFGKPRDEDWPKLVASDGRELIQAALLSWEELRELARGLPEGDLKTRMESSETHAAALKSALEKQDPAAAGAAFTALTKSCQACHVVHRDNPQ